MDSQDLSRRTGLMSAPGFLEEIERLGNEISYPSGSALPRRDGSYTGGVHPNVPQNGWRSHSGSFVSRVWKEPSAFIR